MHPRAVTDENSNTPTTDNPAYYAVAIGGLYQNDLKPGASFPGSFVCTSKVSRIVINPQYLQTANGDMIGDAALLFLSTPCYAATPLALYTKTDTPLFSTQFTGNSDGTVTTITMGWGVTVSGGQSIPNQLRQVSLPTLPQASCASYLRSEGYHTDSMYCAGRATGGVDSCQGDSGMSIASCVLDCACVCFVWKERVRASCVHACICSRARVASSPAAEHSALFVHPCS